MATNVIQPICRQVATRKHSAHTVDIELYLKDESQLSAGGTLGVFQPKDLTELAEILSQLREERRKVTISAARTGVTGGCVPDTDSFVVSLEKLTGLVGVDEKNLEISVQAGTSLEELNRIILEKFPDYFFPVDPTEQSASIGGAAALNAGGARSLRFGSVRNWITGLKVMLVDGGEVAFKRGEIVTQDGAFKILDQGLEKILKIEPIKKPQTKNTVGYFYDTSVDLVDLFIGSEGALGVITEVTVRLERRPVTFLTHLQMFKKIDSALKCVEHLRSSREFPPYSLEFIDRLTIEKLLERPRPSFEKFIPMLDSAEAALFIEIPFNSEDELVQFSEIFFDYLASLSEDPEQGLSGTDEKTLSEIKKLRHAVPERINEIVAKRKQAFPGLHKISMDMAVPDGKLRWLYDLYEKELTKRGFEFVIFGHAGNNHFHTNILPKDLDELERGKQTYLELSAMIVDAGGAVAAEHGIGRLKKRFLAVQYSEEELKKFNQIKKFFDPEMRLNAHILI